MDSRSVCEAISGFYRFILMDDNVLPHRENVTNAYLEHAKIVRMDWPARSLDLNPIKHESDILQRDPNRPNRFLPDRSYTFSHDLMTCF